MEPRFPEQGIVRSVGASGHLHRNGWPRGWKAALAASRHDRDRWIKPPGACKCRSLDAIWSVPVYPGGGRVRRVWRVAMSAFAGGFVLSPGVLRAQSAPVPLSPQMAERSAVRQTDPQAYRIDVWRVD